MVGPERPQIVLFGSSIVQFSFSNGGWGAILADLYARSADIILRGYSGWNSRLGLQVLEQVFPKNAPVQPALVIVYFGGNDSMRSHPSGNAHVPLPEYTQNMRKIAEHLLSLSDKTRVIFLTAPPVNEKQIQEYLGELARGRENELVRIYAEALVDLCKEINVKAIDLWTAFQRRDDWSNTCFTDGIHLTAKGSEIVVREILKILQEADWRPNLHWKSLPVEFPLGIRTPSSVSLTDLELTRNKHWD